jgi:N-methylhydantoinase A/oxoprolinase/acetone carboxylase beta subunit
MIGIGIDTGGTYTDAVIYDAEKGRILASSKALTTHGDLKRGISAAVSLLPPEALKKAGVIALSTTLATNACVEGRGGRGKLILIGESEKSFSEMKDTYGLGGKDVYLLPAEVRSSVEDSLPPDWESFERGLPDLLQDCDCISIVQLFAREHLGALENEARDRIRKYSDIPVILGHDLFPDLNVLRRGSGALLNARLIPVIYEFLAAVRDVFHGYGLDLPIVIVRSDGSLMSEKFSCLRPVETILCGPAASILGAQELTGCRDAVIVDMGGTTTDLAVIRNGTPLHIRDGIQIGSWKTFVKGMFVDTFGLGGDTALHYSREEGLILEEYRVQPLCMLASAHPEVTEKLRELADSSGDSLHYFPLYEFLTLQRMPEDAAGCTPQETRLLALLQDGRPRMTGEIADLLGTDLYNLHTQRLEQEGILLRAGFTPTDVMHLRGDFSDFDAEASRQAAVYICAELGKTGRPMTVEQLGSRVYRMVEERLYRGLVRVLLQTAYPEYAGKKPDRQLQHLISLACRDAENTIRDDSRGVTDNPEKQQPAAAAVFLHPVFHTDAVLVGEGGPTHLFLAHVAEMLGTRAVMPEHAEVANAVGAIAGKICASAPAVLKPARNAALEESFSVLCGTVQGQFGSYDEALAFAKKTAAEAAAEKARQYGAIGEPAFTFRSERKESMLQTGMLFLSETVTASAVGRAY